MIMWWIVFAACLSYVRIRNCAAPSNRPTPVFEQEIPSATVKRAVCEFPLRWSYGLTEAGEKYSRRLTATSETNMTPV